MKMKKLTKGVVVFSILAAMTLQMTAFASTGTTTLTLPVNQKWVSVSATRTGSFNDLHARCYSVYPTNGGKDDFKKIQARAVNSSGTVIANTVTLKETATGPTSMAIKNGYLNLTSFKFQFRGNDPELAAKAEVYYSGR